MAAQTTSRERDFLLALTRGNKPLVRTAVVVAHADDEVVGVGAHLPRLKSATFVYVTDGAPLDAADAKAGGFANGRDYAVARRQEAQAAFALAGVCPSRMRHFEYPDQSAALHLTEIARKLVELLRAERIEAVLTHPYEGGHPDHDATALAVHAARALLESAGTPPPAIAELTSYHNSVRGLEPGTFIHGAAEADEVSVPLTPATRAFKYRLLACFATQWDTLQYFPVEVERFRPAPAYDFTRPPHQGRLFYELHPGGMTGARFRELARSALQELGLSGPI